MKRRKRPNPMFKKFPILFNPTSMQKTVGLVKVLQGLAEFMGIVGEDDPIREVVKAITDLSPQADSILICQHGVFECEKCKQEKAQQDEQKR